MEGMDTESAMALCVPERSVKENGVEENVLDALPYIDDVNYSDEHREFALRLIKEECQKYRPTKNYLAHLSEPNAKQFLTPRILEEHKRISEKKEMEKIDLHRYEVPSPANTSKAGDKKAWQEAITNCKAQLGNQSLRRMNLELMEEYGSEAFRSHNLHLQRTVEKEEEGVNKLRSQLYEINSRRKRTQIAAGENLRRLGENWVTLVAKNAQLEFEIVRTREDVKKTAKRLKVDVGIEIADGGEKTA